MVTEFKGTDHAQSPKIYLKNEIEKIYQKRYWYLFSESQKYTGLLWLSLRIEGKFWKNLVKSDCE